jgi:hypothetical protein
MEDQGMSVNVSVRGWVDCADGQEALVHEIIDRHDDAFYSRGWSTLGTTTCTRSGAVARNLGDDLAIRRGLDHDRPTGTSSPSGADSQTSRWRGEQGGSCPVFGLTILWMYSLGL